MKDSAMEDTEVTRAAKAEALDMMKAAIAAQLQVMLSTGISSQTLNRIGRFCEQQCVALITIEAPGAAVKSRFPLASYGSVNVGEDSDMQLALSPSAPSETYGANVIRQAMPMLDKMIDKMGKAPGPPASTADVVAAIADASRNNLGEEIIAPLRNRLYEICGVPPPGAIAISGGVVDVSLGGGL